MRKLQYVFETDITGATEATESHITEPLRATQSHCRATSREKKCAAVDVPDLSGNATPRHSVPLRATKKAQKSHKKTRRGTPSH